MPLAPGIPYDQVVPGMCPSYYEQAQGIVVKHVHAIVVYTNRNATASIRPFGQHVASFRMSQDHSEKGFARAIYW